MCGIAGVLMPYGPADEAVLRRMAVALAHRGPDDVGIHLAGSLGLTNTRLSIIDVRGGHQPMLDERLGLVAVPERGRNRRRVSRGLMSPTIPIWAP